MKTLLVAILFTSIAQASEMKIASFSQYELWGNTSVSAKFDINREIGRAWVELNVSTGDGGSGNADGTRLRIPGLSYDVESSSIVMDQEGKQTVCAEYGTRGKFPFKRRGIHMSENCKFEGRWNDVTYDNGFEIVKTSKYDLYLVIAD